MARLFGSRLLQLFLLVPLLHAFGFWYALTAGPQQVRNQFGIVSDRSTGLSFTDQYATYIDNVFKGNFGEIDDQPLLRRLDEPLGYSLTLLGCAALVTLVLGPLLGVLAISGRTRRTRPVFQTILTIGAAVPGFFLGSLLIVVLIWMARNGITPGRGPVLPVQGTGLNARIVVPTLTLALRPVLYLAALTAGLLEEELQRDYVRVAVGKGLHWRQVLWRHAWPNIVGPLVVTGGQAVRLLASTLILVEALFDWRGVGRLLMQTVAISRSGVPSPYFLNPVLLAFLLMLFGFGLLLAELIASLAASVVDPHLRAEDAT